MSVEHVRSRSGDVHRAADLHLPDGLQGAAGGLRPEFQRHAAES